MNDLAPVTVDLARPWVAPPWAKLDDRTSPPSSMTQEAAVALLKEVIPFLFASGMNRHVEAVSVALDRLDWANLATAPHDDTTHLVAFAGQGDWPPFISAARWIVPPAGQPLNRHESRRLERNGGWWGSGRSGKSFRTPALAWLPHPQLPTAIVDPDGTTGSGNDLGLYVMEEAA